MGKTINRLWLKNQILKGNIEAKCDYHYSDDYAWDAAVNFNKTDWLPCRITQPHTDPETGRWTNDHRSGYINFCESDFRGYGRAWADTDRGKNGPISLYFGYRSYTLRLKNTAEAKEAA